MKIINEIIDFSVVRQLKSNSEFQLLQSGEQLIYTRALGRAQYWVIEFVRKKTVLRARQTNDSQYNFSKKAKYHYNR